MCTVGKFIHPCSKLNLSVIPARKISRWGGQGFSIRSHLMRFCALVVHPAPFSFVLINALPFHIIMLIILIPPCSRYHLSLIHLRVFFFLISSEIKNLDGETLWSGSGKGERERKNRGLNTESNFPQIFAIRVPAFSRVIPILPCPPLGLLPFHVSILRMENCQQVWLGLNFSGERWRLYRFFSARGGFSYLGWKGLLMSRVFQVSPTDKQWIDLLVKYVRCRNYFHSFHSILLLLKLLFVLE